jgi:hypothetical protein
MKKITALIDDLPNYRAFNQEPEDLITDFFERAEVISSIFDSLSACDTKLIKDQAYHIAILSLAIIERVEDDL